MDRNKIPPNLKVRAKLIRLLKQYVESRGLTQEEVSQEIGTSQPRVSDIVRYRVPEFTVDALINIADEAGMDWTFGPSTSVCSCDSPDLELAVKDREEQPTRFSIHCMGCGSVGPDALDKETAISLWLTYTD